jgi:hypothetical protein
MASEAIAERLEFSVEDPPPVLAPPPARRVPARGKSIANGQRSADYSVTRLVNFRLPVDLHDRFRALVAQVETRHPRLRKASLTELVIALLEEGPRTADEVAELVRRKRLAENEED